MAKGEQEFSGPVILAVCIAKTLHERDPGFLPALKSNVQAATHMDRLHYGAADLLRGFASALDDPSIFTRSKISFLNSRQELWVTLADPKTGQVKATLESPARP